jgi:hypothetical protein
MSPEQAKILIHLARNSILSTFLKKTTDSSAAREFNAKMGVFVTLKMYDRLRGCIGFPQGHYPLYQGVIRAAKAAAFDDPRFSPVSHGEMDDITIEISILTEPKLIEVARPEDYFDKIVIGRDGLIIHKDYHSGLLLPQVFIEYGSTPKSALEMLCQKAGLPSDAWKDAQISSFQSEVFAEAEPNGKIEKII